MTPATYTALTIAGSDPSGGAGIQADLKTFHQFGVYGTTAITLLTVQNTRRLSTVSVLDPKLVLAQLDCVLGDFPCHAAKTGALGNARVVAAIAKRTKTFSFPLVVDPVLMSKKGKPLLDKEGFGLLKEKLLPSAFLVTPNFDEARALSGVEVKDLETMEKAAKVISRFGPEAVLIKGGDLKKKAVDLLYAGGKITLFSSHRVETHHTHGTGCVYSAAITAGLAKGKGLLEAVQAAKAFVSLAIQAHPGLGHGEGPLNLLVTARGEED